MKIVHFCAGLMKSNGMANVARMFVQEDVAAGQESHLTNDPREIVTGVDRVCIHGAWLPILWKVAKRVKTIGAELVVVPHGSYDPVRLGYHGWKKSLVSAWERRMLRRADLVVVTCEAEREWIKAYVGRGCPEIVVEDLRRFFDLSGGEGLGRRSRSTVEDSLHLLYLGRRHPLKGVEFLERAVEELNQSFEHSEHSNIRTINLRIVSDHFGEELERDWDWCDVLVLPTLSENFGLVVAEALERRKRVITTDGAPAWEPPEAAEVKVRGEGGQWRDRIIYLKGYRDGTDEERVRLLKDAIRSLV